MDCLRCGYNWNPKKVVPKQCPSCKQYYYNKPREWTKTSEPTTTEAPINIEQTETTLKEITKSDKKIVRLE